MPMVLGIIDQGDTIDKKIASCNMNQRFMFVYIGSGGSYGRRGCRTVVERTSTGQREAILAVRKFELPSWTVLSSLISMAL